MQDVLTAAHKAYGKRMNSYAFFKIQNHVLGEDLVQDTFIKTWSYLVRGGEIDTMKAFLYHVLNHLIVDEYRKRKTTSLDSLIEKGFEPSDADSGRAFNILGGKAAVLLIQRLPEKYRNVMRMRFVQDLSLKEMSILTGKTRNSIAVQVHRGIAKLRLLYDPA